MEATIDWIFWIFRTLSVSFNLIEILAAVAFFGRNFHIGMVHTLSLEFETNMYLNVVFLLFF